MSDHQESADQPDHESPRGSHSHEDHGHGHHHEGWWHQLRYLRHSKELWQGPINATLVEMVAPTDGEQVLDIGAGMGPGVLEACDRIGDGRVFAVDPSPLMRGVMSMRRMARRLGGRLVVLKGKAEELPLETASIDAAWSINCVHHWGDDQKACQELGRVIRPGGRLALLDEQFGDPTHPRHDSVDHSRHGQPGFFHEIDTERLAGLLGEAGFGVDRAGDERLDGVPVKLIWAVRQGGTGRSS